MAGEEHKHSKSLRWPRTIVQYVQGCAGPQSFTKGREEKGGSGGEEEEGEGGGVERR